MPLYMDRHEAAGPELDAHEAFAAHLLDLEVQKKYDTRYLTYWLDPERGAAFCLVDAPSRDAAESVHRESHGMIASEIIEVQEDMVVEFLGRINDPLGTSKAQPIIESAFRTIVFTDIEGSTRMTQRLGDLGAMELLRDHNEIVRSALKEHGGSEVKHTGDGIMASFFSVTSALQSTIVIQRSLLEHNQAHEEAAVHVRVGLSAGEPVCDGGDLFGSAVQLARRICDAAEPGCIFTSNVIRELAIGKSFTFMDRGEASLKGFDDPVRLHELRWLPE
jgi:class 3 adenylate cyclase